MRPVKDEELAMREATGRRIRAARLAKGYTSAAAFADKIGVDRSLLKRIENGERRIEMINAVRLVKETGVTADWLFFGIDANMPRPLMKAILEVDASLD